MEKKDLKLLLFCFDAFCKRLTGTRPVISQRQQNMQRYTLETVNCWKIYHQCDGLYFQNL